MDEQHIFDTLTPFLRENLFIIILSCIGLIFLGYGVIGFFGNEAPEETLTIEQNEQTESTQNTGDFVTVDVSGAVAKPGVYMLSASSRIHEAIQMAGGLSEQANQEVVARTINLAKPITDGEKIYIPFAADETGSAVLADTTGKTSINTATSTELEDLPGIGPVTAGKVIDARPYSTIDELLTKKVVGQSTFEKIKDQISL